MNRALRPYRPWEGTSVLWENYRRSGAFVSLATTTGGTDTGPAGRGDRLARGRAGGRVPSCPAGALSGTGPAGESLALSFDPSARPACGACVSACPEDAVSVRRVLSSSSLSAGRQAVTEVVGEDRCLSCGRPLAGGLVARAVADQLAASHPQIAGRLRKEDRRTDCLLAVGQLTAGQRHGPKASGAFGPIRHAELKTGKCRTGLGVWLGRPTMTGEREENQ